MPGSCALKGIRGRDESCSIATLNVRTLESLENLLELEGAFEKKNIMVLGLSDVREN